MTAVDYHLAQVTRPAMTAATLDGLLAALPADGSILLTGAAEPTHFTLVHYLVAYLGWPRPVLVVACHEDGHGVRSTLLLDDVPPIAGVVRYVVEPPRGQRPGSARVTVQAVMEAPTWGSLCP